MANRILGRVMWMSGLAAFPLAACFDFGGLSGNTGAAGDASMTGDDAMAQGDAAPSDGCVIFEGTCNGGRAIDIAAGQSFGCALLASGKVWCWGENRDGQTGQAPPADVLMPPAEVPGLSNIVQITAGNAFACALDKDGSVLCWGDDRSGQLGHPSSVDPISCAGAADCYDPTPTQVPGLAFVKHIASSYSHTCATVSTGQTFCWGDNELGQLGFLSDGGFISTATAVSIGQGNGVGVGASDSCTLTLAGNVYCWGSNAYDELGHPSGTLKDLDSGFGYAVDPQGDFVIDDAGVVLGHVDQLAVGSQHACALQGSSVTCWGRFGGPNQPIIENQAVRDIGVSGATQVTAGAFHTCILQGSAGDVQCWGNNYDYALGIGIQDGGYGGRENPTAIGIRATLVRAGYGQTLAIAPDGSVWQWGSGGAFADASSQPSPRPLEGLP